MPPTLRDVIDTALSEVYGQAQTIDATTFLASPLSNSALTVSVVNASGFSRGMVQVDDELMLVSEVDRQANTLTLKFATARGVNGTQAASHAVGALVTMSPAVPRFRAVQAVTEAVTTSPGLFSVGSTEFTMRAAQVGYPMPDDVDEILSVTWLPTGPTKDWVPVRRWTWDRHNRDLVVGDAVTPGRTVRVSYTAEPVMPDQDAEFSETGLPSTCVDVVRFGAAWRLVSFIEPYNLLATRAEGEAMDRGKTPQSRLRVAQYFYQLYSERLRQEVESLQLKYPIRQHWVGRW